jgi:putative alpha-1,2-mannosidase
MYELDRDGRPVHWSPYNGKALAGYRFAGTGFWDTFRALYPFLNLVYPSINKEMQQGLINDYKEGGLHDWK